MSAGFELGREIIVFQAGSVTAAMPSEAVEQITDRLAIRPAKNAPQGVIGAGEFRGQPVPVIDVHGRFGHTAPKRGEARTYIVMRHQDQHVALQVDQVEDVLTIPANALKNIAIPGNQANLGYLKGALIIGDRLLPAIDPAEMVPARRRATPAEPVVAN